MKLAPIAIAAAALAGALWFGTEESHLAYVDALDQVRELEAAGPDALKAAIEMRGGGGDDPYGLPPMWEPQGDTAVVSIRGSLVNGTSGFYRLFGITGYEDIKGAVGEALADKNIKRIVLDIDSGGGAVNGVEDAGAFIRNASKVKPVTSFSGGMMGSAAYWLGISADHVYAARTAQVGSVGVLIVHMEMTEALKDMGRKATLFRYGKYKALGHPYEKLTEEASERIQDMANESGKIFVEYAAERRGTTPEKFQKTMGEGRVLMGQKAHDVGLIDAVMSFETLMSSAKKLDKQKPTAENSRQSAKEPEMKIRALSKAVLLMLAAGTAVESLGLTSEVANVSAEKPEAEDVTALTADATEIKAAFEATKNAAVSAAVSAATAPLTKVNADLTAKVALMEAGTTELNAKVTASTELAATYAGPVRNSIAVMCVALGSTDNTAALQGKELMAAHDALAEQFKAKFPTGGVAAVKPATKKDTDTAAKPDPMFLASVGAYAK